MQYDLDTVLQDSILPKLFLFLSFLNTTKLFYRELAPMFVQQTRPYLLCYQSPRSLLSFASIAIPIQ